MIRQLRKIRENLIKHKSFKKYLLYAIGEIFLVVIGILIALYLNNKNEQRLNTDLEKQYYHTIKDQLKEDKMALLGNIDYNQHYINQFAYGKKVSLTNDISKKDTLGQIALDMTRFSDFRRKSNVYQTLVNEK